MFTTTKTDFHHRLLTFKLTFIILYQLSVCLYVRIGWEKISGKSVVIFWLDKTPDKQKSFKFWYSMHRYCLCSDLNNVRGSRGGGSWVQTPWKYKYWSGSPDNHKATKPPVIVGPSSVRQRNAILMAFRWRTDDGPLIVVWIRPPLLLAQISGSAHWMHSTYLCLWCLQVKWIFACTGSNICKPIFGFVLYLRNAILKGLVIEKYRFDFPREINWTPINKKTQISKNKMGSRKNDVFIYLLS